MMKILVADDNAVSRELVREALEDKYVVLEAADGNETLSKIRSELPDLVLVDIQMPDMDGFGVIAKLRSDALFTKVRAVALTAVAMRGSEKKAIEAGFDGYVTKPIAMAELRRQVGYLISAPKLRD